MQNKLNMRKKAQEEKEIGIVEEFEIHSELPYFNPLEGERRIGSLESVLDLETAEKYAKILKDEFDYFVEIQQDLNNEYTVIYYKDNTSEVQKAVELYKKYNISEEDREETDEQTPLSQGLTPEEHDFLGKMFGISKEEREWFIEDIFEELREEEKEERQEKEASILNMRKFSQSTPETIQKAQAGDENAIAQVIEENIGLISQALIDWGHTPKSDEFEDTMSDIKVEMLNRIIPQYDPSKGAFSTFLSTAVYNFLRRGTREKEYKEKQREVSLAEPVEEGITIEDTLEDKTSEVVQMTLSSARENLQNWLHMNKTELEEVVLRVFDLKVEEYSHERIAEALNQEGYTSKGKAFTRTMVNNYVNDWIKPALAQFFEAFKTAKLCMRKEAQEEDSTLPVPQVTKQELKRLYIQEAQGIYDEKLEDEIISKFIGTLIKIAKYYAEDPKFEIEDFHPEDISFEDLHYWNEDALQNVKDSKIFIRILQKAKTPQEKMIAIDQVIHTVHLSGAYIDYLIVDADAKFFSELGNLKVGNLNMRKKVGVQVFPITLVKAKRLQTLINEIIQSWPVNEDLGPEDIKYIEEKLFNVFKTEELFNDLDNLVDDNKFSLLKIIIGHIRKSLNTIVGDFSSGVHRILQNIIVDVSKYLESFDLLEDEEEEEEELWKEKVHPIKKETPSVKMETELTEETIEASPYAELLRKYSPDEIFDIASGRKEATEEEVEQAKDVISRGIVSNRLGMRKKAQKYDKPQQKLSDKELLQKYKDKEKFTEERAVEYCRDQGMIVKLISPGKYFWISDPLNPEDGETISTKRLRDFATEDWYELYWELTHPEVKPGEEFPAEEEEKEMKEKVEREVEEVIEVPYVELLRKYTEDEIWEIARGRKTDATEEEIQMATDVITRGVVAGKLNMRKKADEDTMEIENQLKIVRNAKELVERDPHLANFMIRDLPITTDTGNSDLVWTMHRSGDLHKNDVSPTLDELEKVLIEKLQKV